MRTDTAVSDRRALLSRGNDKLGRILNFSLPAGDTCPGKTALCAQLCYAAKGHFRRPEVGEKYEWNWSRADEEDFVDAVVAEIRSSRRQLIRVHASGDFDTPERVRQWAEIAARCPDRDFTAYTRSWRDPARGPEMRSELLRISRRPNFHLWLSADRETGRPPRWKSARVAYMQADDADPVPPWADLVFRVERKTVQKYAASGVLTCPVENGVATRTPITCEKCRLCYEDVAIPRKLTPPRPAGRG